MKDLMIAGAFLMFVAASILTFFRRSDRKLILPWKEDEFPDPSF